MGMKQHEAEKKARGLLEQLGLAGHADAYPFSLSGGQKAAGGLGACYDD